jgi:hypothetical protein
MTQSDVSLDIEAEMMSFIVTEGANLAMTATYQILDPRPWLRSVSIAISFGTSSLM